MTSCEAAPSVGRQHAGPEAEYVRLCRAGHFRAGNACAGCAGNGTITCNDCDDNTPAMMIRRDIFEFVLAWHEHPVGGDPDHEAEQLD